MAKMRVVPVVRGLCSVLIFAALITELGFEKSEAAFPAPRRIVIALPAEPERLDPTSTKVEPTVAPVSENISERLIGITPDGKLAPGLASSWKVSSDGKEIEVTLRKGVLFHSGDPLTTRDVAFSHDRAMKFQSVYQSMVKFFKDLEVIDDYRMKFRFNKPNVQFLPFRGPAIASKSYYDRVGEENFVKKPVGTGPYRFVNWEPGQYIEVKANDSYWGGVPSVKEARFVFTQEDATRVAMLKAGEADIILDCPFPLVKELEEAGFKTARVPTHPSCSLQFHTFNPKTPWYDRRVREACAHAIDVDAIVNRVFHGIPGRYARLAPWELGYDAGLKPYAYDPEKAKKLLAEAGYPKGFEMPLFYFIGRVSGQKETTEAVALYLNAVGIRCKVEGIETVRFIEKVREWHKSANAVYAGVVTAPMAHQPEPTVSLQLTFHSDSAISLYRNPEFDKALDEAMSMPDPAKRGELIKKAVRIIHDDVPTVLIWANMSVFAMKPDVTFTPTRGVAYPLALLKDVKLK